MIIKTSGDLGDIVMMLMFLKPLNIEGVVIDSSGGETYSRNGMNGVKCKFNIESSQFIEPLVEKFIPIVNKGYDIDHNEFPDGFLSIKNLTEFHCRKYNLNWEDIKLGWMKSEVPKVNRLIVSRTERYNSDNINFYLETLEKFDGEKIFLGLESEYNRFKQIYNKELDFHYTNTATHLYDIINESTHFIGNGSLANAIACGCGLEIYYEFCSGAANYLFNDERFKIFQ
jgi:hypothetical protein